MKKIFTLVISLITILSMHGCSDKVADKWNGNIDYFANLLMVNDVSNPYTYVGMVDNVFVGTVEKIEKNIIPKKAKHEDNYSVYVIHVDKNLKGNLVEKIVCSKLGGFRKDGTMVLIEAEMPDGSVVKDTCLPELNKQYIFMTYSQPDGSLTLSELFDSRECNDELISEYQEYINNQINIDRERFTSKYDVDQ